MKIALPRSSMNRVDLYEEAGFDVTEGSGRTEEEMIALLRDADGAHVNTLPLTTRRVLEACPRLKVISRFGVGVDSIDLDAATELGVLVCNVPGSNTTEVADHAVALLLALTRNVVGAVATVRAGEWGERAMDVRRSVRRIAGHNVGIIGFGNIGRAFATRMRGFGPDRIIAYDPFVSQLTGDLYGVRMVDLDELLGESDFISIHCSLTDESHHLINDQTLALMRPTALLVNTARGPIVDGAALARALSGGQIEAAALDVTEVEPIEDDNPLMTLPNCLLTPHAAGFSQVFLQECAIRQAQNVIRVLTGEGPPHGLANPEVIKVVAVMRATDPGRWAGVPDFSTALML
ncbi:MAG: hydroxyacid dehydrogenase [Gammaproteobacteria bacterium]|nr:hydroxyacid dehydrogenase [Gammaproteobacteria bacterium]